MGGGIGAHRSPAGSSGSSYERDVRYGGKNNSESYMKLLIIRGVPGSGKSTHADNLIAVGAYDCKHEADDYMMVNGRYVYDASKIKKAHAACLAATIACLSQGRNVIVSNTFTRKWEYAEYVKHCTTAGIPYEVIVLEPKYQNVHNVPSSQVMKMLERFEYE